MNDCQAGASRRKRRTVETWLYDLLGTEYGGNTHVPLDYYGFDYPIPGGTDPNDYYVVRLCEDAFEVWFGTPHEWRFHMNREMTRRFVWWWTKWHIKEVFGLRRWAWYKLLHRKVRRNTGDPA